MQGHPLIAQAIIERIKFLKRSLPTPLYHHEKWNGDGYPFGIAGTEIPLPARIFAAIDVYDALTSNRPYHEATTHELALEVIRSQAGTAFDPDVVREFIAMIGESDDSGEK